MSSYRHEIGFCPQDARLEPLYSRLFPRFFWQFSDCARVTGKPEIIGPDFSVSRLPTTGELSKSRKNLLLDSPFGVRFKGELFFR